MKKAVIPIVISLLLLGSAVIWVIQEQPVRAAEVLPFIVLLILVVFGLYFGYRRIISHKRGEPAEDELSKGVMRKASSLSYYISIYLWLAVMYFSDKTDLETHTCIGMGILGMAVVFAGCWLYYNFRGIMDA